MISRRRRCLCVLMFPALLGIIYYFMSSTLPPITGGTPMQYIESNTHDEIQLTAQDKMYANERAEKIRQQKQQFQMARAKLSHIPLADTVDKIKTNVKTSVVSSKTTNGLMTTPSHYAQTGTGMSTSSYKSLNVMDLTANPSKNKHAQEQHLSQQHLQEQQQNQQHVQEHQQQLQRYLQGETQQQTQSSQRKMRNKQQQQQQQRSHQPNEQIRHVAENSKMTPFHEPHNSARLLTKRPQLYRTPTEKYGHDITVMRENTVSPGNRNIHFPPLPKASVNLDDVQKQNKVIVSANRAVDARTERTRTFTRRQRTQLGNIDKVKRRLTHLHSMMQNDRLYHQFQLNNSNGRSQVDLNTGRKSVRQLRHGVANKIPIAVLSSPPNYEHGYPIEVQAANAIPSANDHEHQTYRHDTGHQDFKAPVPMHHSQQLGDNRYGGNQLHFDGARLSPAGSVNQHVYVNSDGLNQHGYPPFYHDGHGGVRGRDWPVQPNVVVNRHSQHAVDPQQALGSLDSKHPFVIAVNQLEQRGEAHPKNVHHRHLDEYDNPDIRPQHIFVQNLMDKKVKSHADTNMQIPMPQTENVLSQTDGQKLLSNKKRSDVSARETTTRGHIKSDLNISLNYERLPNGDLTVHNVPHNERKSEQTDHANSTRIHMKHIKKDNRTVDHVVVSKVFLRSLTDERVSNNTVATVTKMSFERPSTVHTMNSLWQVQVANVDVFLYSAYFDDRPAVDGHKVRIIGIANVDISDLHCLLWYKDQIQPDISIVTLTKIGPRIQPLDTSKNRYEPYIFTCDLKQEKGPPTEVSLITPTHIAITSLLKVQQPEKPPPGKQIEVGQCMSVVYWHQDPVKVVEWLELHRIWGVGEITTYINNLSPATTAVFKHYARDGWLDLHQMPNILDDDSEFTILLNMSPAINDCMYRNMYRYKKILCTDVDEMIVPRDATNYKDMLDHIVKARDSKHPHVSFMFRNVYFFTDFKPMSEEPWFLLTQRYLKHIKPSEFGYSVKSITDPQACLALQNHLCWKRIGKYDTKNWVIDVPIRYGRSQHYKKCHFDAYLGQLGACERMMKEYYIDRSIGRFSAQLYQNSVQKLIELKIAEPVN